MSFICKAPWVSIAFQPDGKAGPCCVYELDNLSEVVAPIEDTFARDRSEFLAGQIPNGCKKCHHSFLETGKSLAESFNRYKTYFKSVSIQEINVKSNNICNLACRSCGPHFSSKWEEEFAPTITITRDSLVAEKLKLLNMSNLRQIVIAGGEPTLTQEHVDVLQHLIDIKHTKVEIRISTNITNLKYKQIDLLSLWGNFPNLILQLSIDAVGDRAKNIRSGTDWDLVSNNLKLISQTKTLHYVNVTVSALNIWFLEDTLKHLKNVCGVKEIRLSPLFGPEELSIQVIPDEYRADINAMLDRCEDLGSNLSQIKTYLNSGQKHDLWPKFLIYNLILDHTRKENFFELLPIRNSLIDQWVKL